MPYDFNPILAQRRKWKLDLLEIIKTNPNMDSEQIIALFSLKTGLRRETIIQYWVELEKAGVITHGRRHIINHGNERSREALKRINDERHRAIADNQRAKLTKIEEVRLSRNEDCSIESETG